MHDLMDELYDLCEYLEADLKKTNEKIEKAGGELSGADLEYVDKLTHSLKSIKGIMVMLDDEGYSERGNSYEGGGSNRGGNQGGSNRGGNSNRGSYESYASYARGRRNARRDSMGRYSREGYSRAEGFRAMIEEAMQEAPNEQVKMQLRNVMNQM